MSGFGGSNIVTNGLVLCLDAANIKSYSSGSTWTDLSSARNNGAIQSGVTYNSSGWFDFNGTSGYVNLPTTTGFSYGSSAGTICAWAKTNTITGSWSWIFSYGGVGTNLARFIGINGSTYYAGGYANDISTSGLPLNTWVYITEVYDGTTAYLYVNGVLLASAVKPWSTYGSVTNTGQVGRQVNGGEYWNGSISVVQVYNRALSANEVKQNYNASLGRFVIPQITLPSGIICSLDPANTASWPGSGSNLIDLTGNGYNFAATSSDFATYNNQTVLRLDGNVSRRAITGLNITLPYTILAVSRYNGLGSNRRGRTITSNSNNWLMNHWGTNKRTYFAEGWVSNGVAGGYDNDWVIGIVTGTSGDYRCFFDGTTDSAAAPAAGTAAPGTIALGGWGAYQEPSNCDIGLFLVWNRVLTQTEISNAYNVVRQRFGQ